MKLVYIKYGLVFICIVSIIGFSYPLISLYMSEISESYLSMALLNRYNMTENYFDDTPIVKLNSSLRWNILLKSIGDTKFVLIKVKMVDNISNLPNQKDCIESPSPTIFEIYKLIGNNHSITVPFKWKIVRYDSDSIEMIINSRVVESKIPVSSGMEYTMVFELWVYDCNEQNFVFKWESRTETQCIWNSITFTLE